MMQPADLPEKWSQISTGNVKLPDTTQKKNLGVATRVSSGITKAFEHVEEAIILEDDTLTQPFLLPVLCKPA